MAGVSVSTLSSEAPCSLLFCKLQVNNKKCSSIKSISRQRCPILSNPKSAVFQRQSSHSRWKYPLTKMLAEYKEIREEIIFPSLAEDLPQVVAGFTTKHFGNMSMFQNGAPHCENFQKLERRVDAEGFSWVLPHMVHGSNVIVVNSGGRVDTCDGLVTKTPGLFICVTAADCGTVLLADPHALVIGVCHCGWKGTVEGIVGATVSTMRREGAQSQDIIAFVGPCIGLESFEVGEEVAQLFEPQFVVRRMDWPRPHVDLKGAIKKELNEQGVEAIEVHPACSLADSSFLFSHRGSSGSPDRSMAFIAIRSGV